MRTQHNPKGGAGFRFLTALAGMLLVTLAGAAAQDQSGLAPPATLDESAMFGGANDIVTTIDEKTAAQGVQLVVDTKKYPVFTLGGTAGAGLAGQIYLQGAAAGETDNLYGAVSLDNLSIDYLPSKDLHFNATLASGLFTPAGPSDVDLSAYADLRTSEFTRLYAAASFLYKPSSTSLYSTTSTSDATFSLDELFVDTSIGRQVFFRAGKQKVSWGVGYWYKPADVLSLAAIDPDKPTAAPEGPYAIKVDLPYGKLNQATLYVVPPLNGDPTAFSAAAKTDVVLGGYELNIGAYARSDLQSKPRAMFMFTGALGPFDVYGENVLSWGADRTYVRSNGSGGYALYTVDDRLVFQSTLGIKYSYSNSNGFSFSAQAQGYYNGSGYQDSSILEIAAARNKIKNNAAYKYGDLVQTGMYYLAGSSSLGGRWGEGKKLTEWTLSAYALANFSDGSVRAKPSLSLSIGDQGSTLDLSLSALSTFGKSLSEYAPNGITTSPALSMTILQYIVATVSAPIRFNDDYTVKKAGLNLSLVWSAVDFDRR